MAASTRPLLVVIGGFLGAGKTTTIQHVARRLHSAGQRVAIITNDQSSGLVDTHLARSISDAVIEIPDGCFCCRFDTFYEALNGLVDAESSDVILAEAVGSCTDLAATVYQPLRQLTSGIVGLGPLTVVADGPRLRDLYAGEHLTLSSAVAYLHEQQLAEADIILLNKIDQLTAEEQSEIVRHLSSTYAGVTILPVSASQGTGLEQWCRRLVQSESTGDRVLDLDYDRYARAESCLGWVNLMATVMFPETSSGADWLRALLDRVAVSARRSDRDIAHIKAWVDTITGTMRGHLTGTDRTPDISTHGVLSRHGRLLINARAPVSPDILDDWIEGALQHASSVVDTRVYVGDKSAFSPARPVPLHRLLPLAP